MDADRRVEVGLLSARLHRDADALHHLAGLSTNHVATNNTARTIETLADNNHLHQHPLLLASASGHGVLHGLELSHVHINAAVLHRRIVLCEATSANRWLAENSARNIVVVWLRRLTLPIFTSEHGPGHCHTLHESDWGQSNAVSHVTNGKNRWHVCPAVLVNQDLAALLVNLYASLFQAHLVAVRSAPSGEHHIVYNQLSTLVGLEAQLSVLSLLDGQGTLSGVDMNTFVAQNLRQVAADIFVEATEREWLAVDEVDLSAVTVEVPSELHGNVAASDDN
mmetsp:Transcript_105389/g.263748  ORF Transcript_105389/g.263748 Transcript_105389/m.263748 type:complete len:280 (+) Transcript_105389:327-1166(+)